MAIDSAKAAKVLNQARRNPAALRYFFDNLNSPDWIDPLKFLGVFKTPAPIVREAGYVSFPDWPEARFLARMAGKEPQKVRDIILEIPSTDNFSVHRDFIVAALQMPVRLASSIAIKEAEWIEQQNVLRGTYPEKVGDLISYLAHARNTRASLVLAKSLLAIIPSSSLDAKEEFSSEPTARFDNWHYARIFERDIVGSLAAAAPAETFKMTVDLLERAIEIHNKMYPDATQGGDDLSSIWRPAIEQERLKDIMDTLVTGVRDVAIRVSSEGVAEELSVLEELRGRKWRIFKRIAVYVLAKIQHSPLEDVEPILLERSNYEHQGLNPEFDLLLANFLGRSSDAVRSFFFQLIEAGPNRAAIAEKWRQGIGREPTDEEFERGADHWRLSWLAVVSQHLPPDWKARLEGLKSKYGEPELRRREITTTWVGPKSPLTADELTALSVEALVTYLKEFRPSGDPASPTPEGLARTLSSEVARNPAKYASEALAFKGLHPTYIRGFVEGLRTAIKEDRSFSLKDVFILCSWVTGQPKEIEETLYDADRDWGAARREIAALINEATSRFLPEEANRTEVWRIISDLLGDPDPCPEREIGYATSKHFAGMLSLNSVRGVALEAVIHYGLWLQHLGIPPMEDIAPVLERHLDLSFDPSYAVREVTGRLFPWLAKLDENWAAKLVSVVFPDDNTEHRWIAWENYILFTLPYDLVLPMLRNQYLWAITQSNAARSKESAEASRHLADHLMSFYWNDKLDLSPGNLIENFYNTVPEDIRAHSLEFLGRSLRASKDEISPEVLHRLVTLWEWRVASGASLKEQAEFGWWFSSGRLDQDWACQQLLKVLSTAKEIDPDWEVVKTLVPLTEQHTFFVLEALGFIVEADREGWAIYGWEDEAQQIISKAIALNDPEVFRAAKRVVDLIVAKGHLHFRALLKASGVQ